MSRDEARRVIDSLEGRFRLMGVLLYGTGCGSWSWSSAGVKDVDFQLNQIVVRGWEKKTVRRCFQAADWNWNAHLARVKRQHEMDLAEWDSLAAITPQTGNIPTRAGMGWRMFLSKSCPKTLETASCAKHHP